MQHNRLIIAMILLLCLPQLAQAQTVVQQTVALASGSNTACSGSRTLTLNGVAAGDTLLVVDYENGSGTVPTVSSVADGVNTYSAALSQASVGSGGGWIYCAQNVAAGNTTVTVTNTGGTASCFGQPSFSEWPASVTCTVDKTTTGSDVGPGTGVTTRTTAALSHTPDFLIAGTGWNVALGGTDGITAPSAGSIPSSWTGMTSLVTTGVAAKSDFFPFYAGPTTSGQAASGVVLNGITPAPAFSLGFLAALQETTTPTPTATATATSTATATNTATATATATNTATPTATATVGGHGWL